MTFLQFENKIKSIKLHIVLPVFTYTIFLFLLINSTSIGLSMSGMPVSDANGWASCIRSLVEYGSWPASDESWCYRRPLYPIIAQIIFFSAGNITIFLLLVNIFFCIAQFYFLKTLGEITTHVGLIIAWVFTSFYWFNFASTQIMSEQLGLILGISGSTFFWKYISDPNNLTYGLISVNLFILGTLVRPGNLLVMLVPVFAILLNAQGRLLQAFLKLVVSASAIPLAIFTYISFFARRSFMSGENSWGTIYGLVKNNSSYHVAYVDLYRPGMPENEFWGIVKESSISMIKDDPLNLFRNIFINGNEFFSSYLFRVFGLENISTEAKLILNLTIFLMFLYSFYTAFKKRLSLHEIRLLVILFCFFISEFIFYGISMYSDPVRAMSTSAILFISFFIVITFRKVTEPVSTQEKASRKLIPTRFRWSFVPAVFLTLSLALTPIGNYSPTRSQYSCSSGMEKVDTAGMIIRQKVEIKNSIKDYWWISVLKDLPSGVFIQAFTASGSNQPESRSVFIVGNPFIPTSGALCITYSEEYNGVLEKIGFRSGTISSRLPN